MGDAGKGLGHAVAIGAVWMLLVKITMRVIGVVSTVILARLLTPEDFGVVAIAMAFFALIGLLAQFGFDTVLIQKQDATAVHYDTAWTLNVAFALLAAALLCLGAPVITDIYEDERLQPILYAVAVMFVLTGTQNVGVVDFRKHLQFDREFLFATLPRVIGFVVTIPLAYWLRSYWALVVGSVTLRLSSMILSYVLHAYRPTFSVGAWRELFYFSKWLMIRNFFQFLSLRSPELVVGKIISPASAGFLTVAKELSMYAVVDVVATINRATYPGYAKISSETVRLRELFLKVLGAVALYVIPASFGLAFVADPLIPLFLGSQWLPAIPLVQVMAVAFMLIALNTNTLYIFLSRGNPRVPALVDALRVLVLIPALIVGSQKYGLIGAAMGILFSALTTSLVLNYIMRRHLGLRWTDLLGIYKRPVTGTAGMLVALCLLNPQLMPLDSAMPILYLGIMGGIGVLVYGLLVLGLWQLAGCPEGAESKAMEEITTRWRRLLGRSGA